MRRQAPISRELIRTATAALVARNGDSSTRAASIAWSELCPAIRPTVCWPLGIRQVAAVATPKESAPSQRQDRDSMLSLPATMARCRLVRRVRPIMVSTTCSRSETEWS